jgi:hypothetical protein
MQGRWDVCLKAKCRLGDGRREGRVMSMYLTACGCGVDSDDPGRVADSSKSDEHPSRFHNTLEFVVLFSKCRLQ